MGVVVIHSILDDSIAVVLLENPPSETCCLPDQQLLSKAIDILAECEPAVPNTEANLEGALLSHLTFGAAIYNFKVGNAFW